MKQITLVSLLGVFLVAWGCDDSGGSSSLHDGGVGDGASTSLTGGAGGTSSMTGHVDGGGGRDGDSGVPGGSDGPTTDASIQPDAAAGDGMIGDVRWAGRYNATGTWDLSGPITMQRTVGDVVADFLIEEIVSRAGVPSVLEEQATALVTGLVHSTIADRVNQSVPAALKPGSSLLKDLATVLASTDVTSIIELAVGATPTTVTGKETLQSLTFGWQNAKVPLPVGVLLATTQDTEISAAWVGKETAFDNLEIKPHAFALRLGRLVLWVADNVLKQAGAASLSQTAANALDCTEIAKAILGNKSTFGFGVGSFNYSVDASDLGAGCAAATAYLGSQVLGLFDMDSGVEIGGNVRFLDDDRDGAADRLIARPGYGGIVTKVRAAVAPRVAATLHATRTD